MLISTADGYSNGRSTRSADAADPASSGESYTLKNREHDFLRLACSELTYNQIADRMCVSPRTVDGYREVVFQKMGVHTRVGMVMEALRHGLVKM